MKQSSIKGCPSTAACRRVRALMAACGAWLVAASAFGHGTPTHQTLMDYGAAKAGEWSVPLNLSGTPLTRLREGAYDEDNGTRSLDHAWNPLSGRRFPLADRSARDAAVDRWNSMVNAFLAGDVHGGDGAGAWHFLGRAAHLVQDMTSPMHVYAIEHATRSCQFESYWQNNDATLRALLTGIGGPLHSNTLDAKATERLDAFTAGRLQYRFDRSCPNKGRDDIRGWSEVMAWTTYFRTTFWGEMRMSSSWGDGVATTPTTTTTSFTDGAVGPQVNTLHVMFPNSVRWINSFVGDDYFEITDRKGYVFRWMSMTDIDDFAACGSPASSDNGWSAGDQDSSKLVGGSDNDDDDARSTGRFFFELRELGRSSSGLYNRYCYPDGYPNGAAMTTHLHEYFGAQLDPLLVRYTAGLLGLANRRVQVGTLDTVPADFAWSRRDNFARSPAFVAGDAGSNFHFVAKSAVTLTAPATNQSGRTFHHWLKDGAVFAGNTNRTSAINTAAAPIPAGGVVYTADFCADLDADEMADWWEQQHFGGHVDGDADSDSDGLRNRHEYLAGTVPTNHASAFGIVLVDDAGLTWSAIPGKTYHVLYADTPSGPWEGDLPNSRMTAPSGQGTLTYTDATAGGEAWRFYRVRLVQP